jgi:hypothetical protein
VPLPKPSKTETEFEYGLAAVLGTDLVRAYAFWDTCDVYEISKRQRSQFFDKKSMQVDVVSAQLRERLAAVGIGLGYSGTEARGPVLNTRRDPAICSGNSASEGPAFV